MNNPVVKESLTTQPSLIDRLRIHLSCYWKEGDVAPHLTSIELMLIEEAADELAAAIAQRDKARVDALEEAAKVCDEYARDWVVPSQSPFSPLADKIRAMKECGK